MKKKIIIVFASTLIVLILIPFVTEIFLNKKGSMYIIEIPWTSYCENKPFERCLIQGGSLIFKELTNQEKIIFKREMTNNNCYEFDFVHKTIQPQDNCTINEASKYDLDRNFLETHYHDECSPTGRYCIKKTVKGKINKSGGIGFFLTPDKLYGLEIFEIEDKTQNKILFRETKVRFGSSMKLTADQYWGDDDIFLIFEKDKRLYYLTLE